MQYILLTKSNDHIAEFTVEKSTGKWTCGQLSKINFPDFITELFDEFQSLVEDQCFSLVDEAQDRVNELGLSLLDTQTGQKYELLDAQLFDRVNLCFLRISMDKIDRKSD